MANPTLDKLAQLPSVGPSWQDDADGSDANKPQRAESMLYSGPTGLDPTLRRIKSEVRRKSLDPAWVSYLGLDSMPSNGVPTKLSSSSFSLVGDWTVGATNLAHRVALVGRAIRATFSDSTTKVVATILTASHASGVTTITLDSAILTATLSYVEFSALGPATALGPFPLALERNGNDLVVPVSAGGTGLASLAMSGDLEGDYPSPTVIALQGQPVSNTVPTPGDSDQVLNWSGAIWAPATLRALLNLVVNISTDKGTVKFPYNSEQGQSQMVVKWANGGPFSAAAADGTFGPITWDSAFAGNVHGVWICAGGVGASAGAGHYIALEWDQYNVALATRTKTGVTLNYRMISGSPTINDIYVMVIAIGT